MNEPVHVPQAGSPVTVPYTSLNPVPFSGEYRVLVTASRTWLVPGFIHAALDEAEARAYAAGYRVIRVVQGYARGGDMEADGWTLLPSPHSGMIRQPERHALSHDDWYPDGKFDRTAGIRRNVRMIGRGADEALAFIDDCRKTSCARRKPHGSHGTIHCADHAGKAGIPVRRYTA